jgi:hypothetical protein
MASQKEERKEEAPAISEQRPLIERGLADEATTAALPP